MIDKIKKDESFLNTLGWLVGPCFMKKSLKNKLEAYKELNIYPDNNIQVNSANVLNNFGNFSSEEINNALRSLFIQTLIKQKNRDAIAEIAYNYFDEQTKEKSINLREDFKARFFVNAEDVTAEEIQKIYSSLLIAEIKSENSISYRVMDVVKNLDPEEVRIFEKYRNTIFNLNVYNIKFNELQRDNEIEAEWQLLEFAGLVEKSSWISCLVLKPGEQMEYERLTDKYILANNGDKPITLEGRALTETGIILGYINTDPIDVKTIKESISEYRDCIVINHIVKK